jgi:queuine tRNA-ribosyltransferase
MNWNLPILTDSGGFQVMSLSKLNKIDKEKGAIFQSHIDGKKFILSPEESMRIQKGLNSEIVMVMDECPKISTDYKKIEDSMNLSTYWAKRSKKAFGKNLHKGIFGIVQGGLFSDLRIKSLHEILKIGFDGYALGGLAVGETQKEMFKILDDIIVYMPKDKPRYLMGVGTPGDILGAVKRGVDMFDCVLPTRSGRTGLAFTWNGRINIRNAKYKKDNSPLDKNTKNFQLFKYSKNYLNHLFNTNEMLGSMLLTLNNINFYQELMSTIRKNIKNGTFSKFHDKYIDKL